MRFGCFVEDAEQFDASAFRLAAGEAVSLDPQARILLEQTGQAFAQADQAFPRAWDAATGVYVGCMYTEYLEGVLGPLVRLAACLLLVCRRWDSAWKPPDQGMAGHSSTFAPQLWVQIWQPACSRTPTAPLCLQRILSRVTHPSCSLPSSVPGSTM